MTTTKTSTLAEALPKELARARRLLGYYKEIGLAGALGVEIIEQAMARADRAVSEGDTAAMAKSLSELRQIKEN